MTVNYTVVPVPPELKELERGGLTVSGVKRNLHRNGRGRILRYYSDGSRFADIDGDLRRKT